jgi:putative peptide zinc metalloprotease protein
MDKPAAAADLERRKQVRLRLRGDLSIEPQKFEGRTYFVVKDPVSLRYYRFKEQEQYLLQFMDGRRTLDEAQKQYEVRFRPERLTLEDLESFAQQLLTAGLAQNESPKAGTQLFDRRKKRLRKEWMQTLTNILYIKIPVTDPDFVLEWMLDGSAKRPKEWKHVWHPLWILGWLTEKCTFGIGLRWMFTTWFLVLSIGFMMSAILLVATHFQTFRDHLPSYHEFFSLKTVGYLWLALGLVKVIHEFGHGLSCKAFGGEVHEMGALFLCFSPCLYANVSDAWTLPNKWHRIVISAAGIYVELIIATIATWIWWNSPADPFIKNMALSLMIVCSVSTVVFNANPLMRYDGYYVLADWLEIPNLRDRSNRYLKNVVLEHCLGVEVQPEPYMALWRRCLFVGYAVISWVYRWVITFSILVFMATFLKPYKLQVISQLLAVAAAASMFGWPLYNLGKNLHRRGRLPDMKRSKVTVSAVIVGTAVLFFLFFPLPVSRVNPGGYVLPTTNAVVQVQPDALDRVFLHVPKEYPCLLEDMKVRDGESVEEGQELAVFSSRELDTQLLEAETSYKIAVGQINAFLQQKDKTPDLIERKNIERNISKALGERNTAYDQMDNFRKMKTWLVLRAPRSGTVMSPPKIEEIGKVWERDQGTPFCSVGDQTKLRVLLPLGPAEYSLLDRDTRSKQAREGENAELEVTIRVQGRDGKRWTGHINPLPESEAKDIPLPLSSKAGGPVAVRPSSDPNKLIPQSQQYLVAIDLDNPDNDHALLPGMMAQVKVHCRWRSGAWWVWRSLSSTFDLGLW